MSLDSSCLPIAESLVALIQTFQNPATGLPLYQYVKLGSIFDPTPYQTFCDLTYFQGQGGPAGSGGNEIGWRIDDQVVFQLSSGFGPYQLDSTAAEKSMLATRDIVLPLLRKHFQLPNGSNPSNAVQSVYRILVQQADRSHPVKFPGGNVYKLWYVWILVSQNYNVELVQP